MNGYTITFHSPSEGISFGVTSDSLVGALSMLVEEFGEGAVPLFEHARQQFSQLCREVEISLNEKPRAIAAATDGGQVSSPVPKVEAPAEHDAPAVDTPESSAVVGEEVGGETLVNAGVIADNGGTLEKPAFACVICNVPITADRARATQFMTGESRCMDCAT